MLPALAEAQKVQALQDTAAAVAESRDLVQSIGARLGAVEAGQDAILAAIADLKASLAPSKPSAKGS